MQRLKWLKGLHNKLAESPSRKSVQCDCLRRNEAGHAVPIGPRKVSITAWALRFSGTMQSILLAEQSIGIVSVKAYCGTAAKFG